MASKIGIKLADGSFFPIMDEDSSTFETLELTTVRDEQQSVQINLFKKEDSLDPQYIGSLVVEDIHQKKAGEATIALKLSLDEEKKLSAEALYVESGTRQELEVSLKTFDEAGFDTVDFDLNERTDDGDEEESDDDMNSEFSTALFYTDEEEEKEEKKRGMPVWLIVLLVLLGIAALVLAVLLLSKKTPADTESQTSGTTIIEKEPAAVESASVEEKSDTAMAASADSNTEAPAASDEPELPADMPTNEPPVSNEPDTGMAEASEPVAATDPAPVSKRTPAVRHKIRWGDTLWDLSETYYRNPWLYKKIADYNNLKNPDIIVSGTYIEIPPQ